MKKISILFVVIALMSAQIVKAADIKDATLKEKGTQNEASTVAWLQAPQPDHNLITMSIKDFNRGFLACIAEFNQKYKTFPVINSDVLNDDIIPQLYTADLDPNRLYTFSLWNVTERKWGRWTRKAKSGETGLFYKGWDEPIMSVYCWNFGYPTTEKAIAPKVEEPKVEYVYIKGSKKVITYEPDTVEINRTKVQIERNNISFASYNNHNNQSFTVDMSEPTGCNHQQQAQCNHQQVQQCNHQQVQQQCNHQQVSTCGNQKPSCGCDGQYTCRKHKNRKPFFERRGVKILSYFFVAGLGWVLNDVFDRDDPRVIGLSGVTQGPFGPLPTTNPIYTHAPVSLL